MLQFGIDGQRQVVARHRRGARQRAYRAAAGIDFDLLEAGRAVQFEFVVLLQPGLADVVGAAIVGLLSCLRDFLQIAIVDPPDIAEQVRGEGAARILAKQPRLDFDAGKAIAIGDERRHFLVGQPGADRQRFEVAAFVQQLPETLAILGLDVDECRPGRR